MGTYCGWSMLTILHRVFRTGKDVSSEVRSEKLLKAETAVMASCVFPMIMMMMMIVMRDLKDNFTTFRTISQKPLHAFRPLDSEAPSLFSL